jgi:hypothetical protein
LFGPSDGGHFSLEKDRTADIIQITHEENEKLTSIFIEQEVKEVIFQMSIIRHLGSMASLLNSITYSRRPLKGT